MVPLFRMVSWEHISMMLMIENFEYEQQTHEELDSLVAYA
jgi:hypothetical protein